MCVFYDGNSRRLNRSGFMEMPGIEPATPGLQDIRLSPTPRRLHNLSHMWNCYDIKPVRKEEGKSYWKIPLCDDDATREK